MVSTVKAQKGIDPANPTNDPLNNRQVEQKREAVQAAAKAEQARLRDGGRAAGIGAPLPPPGLGLLLDTTL